MTIKISNWYGRLGNNIQQCAIGILIAINRKDRFESIDHEIIKPIRLDFGSRLETFSANYYYWNGNSNTPNISTYKVYKDINYICQKYIFKNLDIPKIEVSNKTLVIHLRSGDLFKYPIADYVPNPLIYYQNLIDQYEKTLIVTEKEMNNPLLEKLKDNSKVLIQQGTIQQDFATLIGAKNLATSGVGTFAISAALCSKDIKNLYCSKLFLTTHLNYLMLKKSFTNVYIVDFKEYIKIGDWENRQDQHLLIVNYKKNLKFQKYKKNKFKIIIINFLIDLELYFKLRINKHNFFLLSRNIVRKLVHLINL